MMRRLLATLAVSLFFVAPASAGPFDVAAAAYARGDYATALPLFRSLADQGNTLAQNNLGIMYHEGQGVSQNYAEAAKWYRLAADQGNTLAQNNLGIMYHEGRGVPRNDAGALRWSRLAADKGYAQAQYNLGFMSRGRGGAQNYVEAAKWFRLAANQGDVQGQVALAAAYGLGQGVARDSVNAYMWLSLAAAQGDKVAASVLSTVAQSMTVAQIAAAQKLARNWRPTTTVSQAAAQPRPLSDKEFGLSDEDIGLDTVVEQRQKPEVEGPATGANAEGNIFDQFDDPPDKNSAAKSQIPAWDDLPASDSEGSNATNAKTQWRFTSPASMERFFLFGVALIIPISIWLILRLLNEPQGAAVAETAQGGPYSRLGKIRAAFGLHRRALEGIGGGLAGIAFFAALVCFVALWIMGLAWVSENVASYVYAVSQIAVMACVFILTPLALFGATRRISAYGFFLSSVLFGLATWILGFLVTLDYWGGFGVFVGIVMLGVGVVPMGILAAALHADWPNVGQIGLCLVITFGARMSAVVLTTKIDRDEATQPGAERAAKTPVAAVGEHYSALIRSVAKIIHQDNRRLVVKLEPKYFFAFGAILAIAGLLLLDHWMMRWGFWANIMVGTTFGIPYRYVLLCALGSISWGVYRHAANGEDLKAL
jgi:hypothetical protein